MVYLGRYIQIIEGKCTEKGYSTIVDKSTCNDAGKSLGLSDNDAVDGTGTTVPYGCYWKSSNSPSNRLWLNILDINKNNGATSLRNLLCRTTGLCYQFI